MDIEPALKIFHERVGVGRRERDEFFREGWEEVSMDNLSFKGAEGELSGSGKKERPPPGSVVGGC